MIKKYYLELGGIFDIVTKPFGNLHEYVGYENLSKDNWYNRLEECKKAVNDYVMAFKKYIIEHPGVFDYDYNIDAYILPFDVDYEDGEGSVFVEEYALKDINKYIEKNIHIYMVGNEGIICLKDNEWKGSDDYTERVIKDEMKDLDLPF